MAFKLGTDKTGGGHTALSEINVTPFVDVMLVLLIVFMVSAPLMKQGAQVDLPKANTGTLNDQPNQVFLSVTASRQITLDGKAVPKGELKARLEALSRDNPDIQVYVQADQTLPYGVIAQVIAEAKAANIHRVGLVTQPGNSGGSL